MNKLWISYAGNVRKATASPTTEFHSHPGTHHPQLSPAHAASQVLRVEADFVLSRVSGLLY
jgi:hypothetical protein